MQTNFVQVDVAALGLGEYEAVDRLAAAGVLLVSHDARRVPCAR